MKQAALANPIFTMSTIRVKYSTCLFVFFAGLLGPFGFAPYHLPGLTLLSIALLYSAVLKCKARQGFTIGFIYGMGYFGFGVSWVIISIHDYGQLNYFLSGIITLLFIIYLSLFPALTGYCYKILATSRSQLTGMILFSTLWCLSEYIRATLFSGFPWLLIGTTQIDTPLKFLAPIFGVFGLSLFGVFASTLLTSALVENSLKRYFYLSLFISIIIIPSIGQNFHWTQISKDPVSIGVVQANLSMRDKWDEALFWDLLKYYEKATDQLMGKQLIILPESAIPLPASYLEEYLLKLHKKALKAKSSLILGILQPTDESEVSYYNSIISLGRAHGEHIKRQLVPFGEYIPGPFVAINHWLGLPEPNILPGVKNQNLVHIDKHPIASLICYEIAYPNLVRLQMPLAQWIVSISDNGWFGHSLASYQQLQMAQMLSLLTGRYQVVVNNDGLSSIVNDQGNIVEGLPPFSSGILQSEVFPAQGSTPWIIWSEYPALIFCALFLFFILFLQLRRLPKQ